MPTEDDLRDMFAAGESPRPVDSKKVIARSRARRVPRQIAAGAVGALAVAGVLVVGIQATQLHQPPVANLSQGAAPESATGGSASDSSIKRAPADKINLCEGTLADAAPSFYGLELDVTFPASAPTGTAQVEGTVRLVNNGSATVTGSSPASPAITVSQNGVVLWHSNGVTPDIAVPVNLAPGQSMEYPATFTPVQCGIADDEAESFRDDLPPLAPGTYNLSAAMDFSPDAAMTQQETPGVDLVTGPASEIQLN